MDKLNKIENRQQDYFHIEESFDDDSGCIHLPVTMPKIKGIPDVDLEIDHVIQKIHEKYKQREFNGKIDFIPTDNGIKEYLFFYK